MKLLSNKISSDKKTLRLRLYPKYNDFYSIIFSLSIPIWERGIEKGKKVEYKWLYFVLHEDYLGQVQIRGNSTTLKPKQ